MTSRTELTPQEIDTVIATAQRRGSRKLAVRRAGSSPAAMALVAGLAVGAYAMADRTIDSAIGRDEPAPVTAGERPSVSPSAPDDRAAQDETTGPEEETQEPATMTFREKNAQVAEIMVSLLPEEAKYRLGESYDYGDAAPYQPTYAHWLMEDEYGTVRVGVQLSAADPAGVCVAPVCTEVVADGGVVHVLDGAADGKAGQQMAWQFVRDDGYEIVLSISNRTVREYSDGSKAEEFTREGPLPLTTEDAITFLTDPAWDAAVEAEIANPVLR
ncbi:hypothetical protein GCM10025789_22170 [Tessaracoccus lubricantis]|uniref:Lipoprotein n=1 Tax=Tessaracoccus lubricantis TaxID=545543 RepID=A0ABP9FRF2_9ACTN